MIWKKSYASFLLLLCLIVQTSYASLIVPMVRVDAAHAGQKIGSLQLDDTIYGMLITPHLHGLPPGVHGFAVHALPFCNQGAVAAGGHFDPEHNRQHQGPYRGNGHLGDLPVLIVNADGQAILPVLAPRLKTTQVHDRSIIIIAGSDNYAVSPLKINASKMRMACGVVPYH